MVSHRAKAHPRVIASRLGDNSVRTMFDVYRHCFEDLNLDTTDSLGPPSNAFRAYFRSGTDHRLPNPVGTHVRDELRTWAAAWRDVMTSASS